MSHSNGHRSPVRSLDHIAELAQTLAPLLEDAADAGARTSGGLEFVGRASWFHRLGPDRHRGARSDPPPDAPPSVARRC